MKLTESRIKEIIREEIEQAQQGAQSQEEETKTLQHLKAFLLNLSKQASQIKGASPAEVKAAADLIIKILKSLPKGEVSKHIQYADQQLSKKLGDK
jgi:hypothetical protein